MDILPFLLKKYPFWNTNLHHIFYDNIFFHLHTTAEPFLFVFDGNVSYIVENYINASTVLLALEYPRAKPTHENVSKVIHLVLSMNITRIFAFGTGAINDICKVASNLTNIPFTFVPTAFSMNGIVANNASIYADGIKKSFVCKSADIIAIEPSIIESAPKKFIGSAIMDCLAGYTANNDFLFASNLDSQQYCYEHELFLIFHNAMQDVVNLVEKHPYRVHKEEGVYCKVFELLYISGSIMNHCGSSIAFSGGEHHIAHTVESFHPHIAEEFLHGEVISAILPFYAQMQKSYTGNDYIPGNVVKQNNMLNFQHIAKTLGMPQKPEDLGISSREFNKCLQQAKYAKERPTILNLLF